jgi:hypothetical protein
VLPTSQISFFLQKVPPEFQDIVLELRSLIASVAPYAIEVRHSRGFSYYDDRRGGPVSAGICQIIILKDYIRLAFIHGAFLPDPHGLLQGEAKYKKYIRLDSFSGTPWDHLKTMIEASTNFDPYRLAKR